MILYGQTSSGKTYTLFGDHQQEQTKKISKQKLIENGIKLGGKKNKNEIVSNLKSDLINLNYKDTLSQCLSVSESQVKTKARNNQIKTKIQGKSCMGGIIPRYLTSLFKEIDKLQNQEDLQFTFEYSFFEIYKEKIFDLINQTYDYVEDGNGKFRQILKPLNLREKKNNQIVIGKTLGEGRRLMSREPVYQKQYQLGASHGGPAVGQRT
jgi:hypothetical protein